MHQEVSEQINYVRPRERMKCQCSYLYYVILFLLFWYFLKSHIFSDSSNQVPGEHQN